MVTQATFIWGTFEEKAIPWHQEAMERQSNERSKSHWYRGLVDCMPGP